MAAAMSTMGLVPSTEQTALALMVDERLRLQQQLETTRAEPGGFKYKGTASSLVHDVTTLCPEKQLSCIGFQPVTAPLYSISLPCKAMPG